MKAKEVFKKGQRNIGYVSSTFTNLFGDMEVDAGQVLIGQKLTKAMSDPEILKDKDLNVQECTLGDVLATMNNATDDMKDGYANIFYIEGTDRVVNVYWDADDREWVVFDWRRDDGRWNAGYRVFSPATDARSSGSESCASCLGSRTVLQQFADWVGSKEDSELEVVSTEFTFVVIRK